MRIGLDIRPILKREKTGIGYYTLNLVHSLARIDADNIYLLYSKIRFFSKSKRPPRLPSSNFKNIIDRLGLGPPFLLNKADVFYSSAFDIKPPCGAKFILGIHDIIPKIFPQWHSNDTKERLDLLLGPAIARADAIIVDAHSTVLDLDRYYPGNGFKIRVVYPGVGDDLGVLPPDAKNLYKSVFFLYNIYSNYTICVSTIEPRKNIKGLIEAFILLKKRYGFKQQLVIVGMKGWGYDEVYKLAKESGSEKDIIFTGYVPRDVLNILYNFADLSVYPSFYEGAGLPVLEAFKCGCPVVASDVSCIKEFAGGAAVLVDPHSVESIGEGIYMLLKDEQLRNGLRQKGLSRAADWTWERAARQMLEIFKNAAV